jgi:hypothetical protein
MWTMFLCGKEIQILNRKPGFACEACFFFYLTAFYFILCPFLPWCKKERKKIKASRRGGIRANALDQLGKECQDLNVWSRRYKSLHLNESTSAFLCVLCGFWIHCFPREHASFSRCLLASAVGSVSFLCPFLPWCKKERKKIKAERCSNRTCLHTPAFLPGQRTGSTWLRVSRLESVMASTHAQRFAMCYSMWTMFLCGKESVSLR